MESLNGDFSQVVVMRCAEMEWTASPSGTVHRKRLHRVGPAEAGQVTSVVRYEPNSKFPQHDHPDGEEILVLEGTFSDEHDDYPAGTHLFNPHGFVHAPFSREGCLLFVKLRQYPGTRPQRQTTLQHGTLFDESGFPDVTSIEQWEGPRTFDTKGGLELFVLEGSVTIAGQTLKPHDWIRLPDGHEATATTSSARVYAKRGAFELLLRD